MKRTPALLLLLSLFALPSCAWMFPSRPYLPNRSGIQEGEPVTVKPNENIYAIAREHNVSMRDLIVLNNLKPPFEVSAGQTLHLPAGGTSSFGSEMAAPTAAPLAAVEKNELAPIEPAAVSSQSLEPVVPVAPAATAPTATPVWQGKPAGLVAPQSYAQPTPVAKPVAPAAVVATASPEPVVALNKPSPPQTTAIAPTTATQTAAASAVSVDSASDMIWPLQGPILSAYGAKGAGLANDGVNIGAPKGSPVVAAAAGTVVYAGNEMKGFGNLVLIRHQGDWVTAYAHLERVLAKKDSVVGQGDMIGTVGKTGNVSTPQLHFETRKAGKPVDPAQAIKGSL